MAHATSDFDGHTVWQVKASTLCNLRCRYCYEWDRLGDKRRMTLDQWRRVFEAAAAYQNLRLDQNGVYSKTFIAWHGGEATLLPHGYVDEVLDLQVEVLGQEALDTGLIANAVQTNLYRRNKTLDLMVSENFLLSVSLDFISGARVNVAGRDAEADTIKNLQHLLEQGVTCGVALVLGRHNHEHLCEIHDHLEQIDAAWLRIIPMLRPPSDAPSGDLQLTAAETVAALAALLEHRNRNDSQMPVSPLDRVQRTVHGYRHQVPFSHTHNRGRFGETRIVVHPDGTIASEAGTTKPHVLGNIFKQNMEEIVNSSAYRDSLLHDDAKREKHCGHCRYENFCNQRAVLEDLSGYDEGPCKVDAPLCDFLDQRSG